VPSQKRSTVSQALLRAALPVDEGTDYHLYSVLIIPDMVNAPCFGPPNARNISIKWMQ